MTNHDIVIRMAGTAGEGALVLGEMLAQGFAKSGWDLMLSFSFDAEVRGEKPSYSQLRVSGALPRSQGEAVDLLLGLNRGAVESNLKDLASGGVVIYDGRPIDLFHGEEAYFPALPEGTRGIDLHMELISQKDLGFPSAKNMVALGCLARVLGMPVDVFKTLAETRFKKKGANVIYSNVKALDLGYAHSIGMSPPYAFREKVGSKLLISGNRASSLGAMAGGCTFYAGYPITPATEVMEQLAHDLPALCGTVIQAEDEISALGMVLGASYAGHRALTATSGPGLSLMSEMLGLSEAAEVPAVVLDVQRGGPSTGLPTKPEQSDLDMALYGGHGDTARIVLAPTSVAECFYATGKAMGLAQMYQLPVIILTDQFLAYRRETLDWLDPAGARYGVRLSPTPDELKDYMRYRLTDNGVSPMSVPGEEGGSFVATGLEHNEHGGPAYDTETHRAMSAKRHRKLASAACEKWFFSFGDEGADVGVLAWGSVAGAAREAVDMACASGVKAKGFYTVYLSPLPEAELRAFIGSVKTLIVPELNQTGQFARLIRERFLIAPVSLAVPYAGPFPASIILDEIRCQHA